jgi:hypothetical protein
VRTSLVAALKGAFISDPLYITGFAAGAGTLLSYMHAQLTKRALWISPAFQAEYPGVYSVLNALVGKTNGSKWSLTTRQRVIDIYLIIIVNTYTYLCTALT